MRTLTLLSLLSMPALADPLCNGAELGKAFVLKKSIPADTELVTCMRQELPAGLCLDTVVRALQTRPRTWPEDVVRNCPLPASSQTAPVVTDQDALRLVSESIAVNGQLREKRTESVSVLVGLSLMEKVPALAVPARRLCPANARRIEFKRAKGADHFSGLAFWGEQVGKLTVPDKATDSQLVQVRDEIVAGLERDASCGPGQTRALVALFDFESKAHADQLERLVLLVSAAGVQTLSTIKR